MISFTLDTSKLQHALTRLHLAANVSLADVMKQEAAYLVREIIRFTPPKNRTQGQNAIKGDLFGGRKVRRSQGGQENSLGIFQRIGVSREVPPRNGKQSETMGVHLGWEGAKKIRIMRKFWRPGATPGEMAAYHARFKNKYGRTGLVSRSQIGRWKVQDQMWVSDGAANAYFADLKRRVGWAVAGWQNLAMQCGASGSGIKKWSRNLTDKAGACRSNFSADGNPFVHAVAYNTKIPGYQRMIDGAVASRLRTTERKLDAVLKGRAVNLGFTRIAKA